MTKYSYFLLALLAHSPTALASSWYTFENKESSSQQVQLPLNGGDDSIPPNLKDTAGLDDIIAESPLLSLHRTLVETESLSNQEQSVADFLVEYLDAHNFTVEKQEAPFDDDYKPKEGERKRYNVYAYPRGSPQPGIILSSHIDTVPPFIEYSLSSPSDVSSADFKREDVLISGRGTVDAKGSVACQIIAALSHLESNPDIPLGLLYVVSEEKGGTGMRTFSNSSLNTSPPTFHTVLFGEPTERSLVSGHKGGLTFSLSVKGKAAHSGYPWLGRSAVSDILPILSRLDILGDIPESEGGLPASEKYGRTTLNLGLVQGGFAGNVVPANASASGMVRLAAGSSENAGNIIERAILESAGGEDGADVSFHIGSGHGVVDLDADIEGFNVTTVNYSTDVPKWNMHDQDDERYRVKRYLYGPGSILVAHGDDEALTVGELEAGLEGYNRLIEAVTKRERERN